MRKCTFSHVCENELHSACASVQSDQSFHFSHEESLHPWQSKMHLVKILIRLPKVQADLNLCWMHMSEGMLSDVAAHMYILMIYKLQYFQQYYLISVIMIFAF